jgi:acyl-CoA thioesterase
MSVDGGSPAVVRSTPEPAAVANELHSRDPSARAFGIDVVAVDAGRAVVEMAVRSEMCNGHGICHGGLIFTLADSALAFASNSHNENAVAAGASIEFLAPVPDGSVLRATASEQSLRGRTGIYDVVVTLADGTTVALFRGRTQRIGGAVVTGDGPSVEGIER